MESQDEKKPPVGGDVVWRVRVLPGVAGSGQVRLRLEADSVEARALLGDVDVCGHKPVAVEDRAHKVERCPVSGAFLTTGLTLVLSH